MRKVAILLVGMGLAMSTWATNDPLGHLVEHSEDSALSSTFVPVIDEANIPPEIGMLQTDRIVDTLHLIDRVQWFMNTYNRPGFQCSIVRDGQILWTHSAGYATLLTPTMLTDTTIVVLGSTSKLFVGIALMQLWEQGLFDLDTNISDLLPYSVVNPSMTMYPITPRQVMSHVSSIRDNLAMDPPFTFGGDSPISVGEYCESYFAPGGEYYSPSNYLGVRPGTYWSYSSSGITLLAHLVEVLSGMTFEDYCQANIFGPLGMDETSWFLTNLDSSQMAEAYFWSDTYQDYVVYPHWGHPTYPSGFLKTGMDQLTRFMMALMQGGELDGNRIIQAATLDSMLTVQYPLISQGAGYGSTWGMVFWTIERDRVLWGHEGNTLGFRTLLYFSPADNAGVILIALGQPSAPADQTMLSFSDEFFDFAMAQQDIDGDGRFDILDNCEATANPDQLDTDGDGRGDVCDNCAETANADQADFDYDGIGDLCDSYCCGLRTDINHDGAGPDIADLVYLVTYMFQLGPEAPCGGEVDVNGDGSGPDIADLVGLVTYMFQGGVEPAPCP